MATMCQGLIRHQQRNHRCEMDNDTNTNLAATIAFLGARLWYSTDVFTHHCLCDGSPEFEMVFQECINLLIDWGITTWPKH